ncbi:polyketide synthase dehydratase domain-containing protein [Pseudoroseomonas wenyumeiae]
MRLALPEEAPADEHFLLHPVRLDGALQGLLELMAHDRPDDGRAMVPVRFGRLVLRRGGTVAVRAELAVTHRGERSGRCAVVLRDGAGQVVARLEDAWMQAIRLGQRAPPPKPPSAWWSARRWARPGRSRPRAGGSPGRGPGPRCRAGTERDQPAAGRPCDRQCPCGAAGQGRRGRRTAGGGAFPMPAPCCMPWPRTGWPRPPPPAGACCPATSCPRPPRSGVPCWPNAPPWRMSWLGSPWPPSGCPPPWTASRNRSARRPRPPASPGWPRSWPPPSPASPPHGRKRSHCACWKSAPRVAR